MSNFVMGNEARGVVNGEAVIRLPSIGGDKPAVMDGPDLAYQWGQTWDAFFVPGYCLELRALGLSKENRLWEGYATGAVVGYFNDKGKFISAVAALDHLTYKSLQVTINPLKPELLARANNCLFGADKENCAKAGDVAYLRWMRIDIDPDRPEGIPSTEAEWTAAKQLAGRIAGDLPGLSITATSGNGADVLICLPDMPNNNNSAQTLDNIQGRIQEKHTTEGLIIDKLSCKANVAIRVWGSMNRKGSGTGDRPHRRAQLLSGTTGIKPIRLESAPKPEPKKTSKKGGKTTLGQVEAALSCLPPGGFGTGTYQKWVNVLMAVHSAFPGEDGIELCERYMPGKPNEIAQKFKTFTSDKDGGIGIGTLFEIAKEYGYEPVQESNADEGSTYDLNFGGGKAERVAAEYTSDGNAMFKIVQSKRKGESDLELPIADFLARITRVITSEDGAKTYTLAGQAKRGGAFTCEISANDFEDTRALKAALGAAAGYRDAVYPGMAEHLNPAIKFLSGDDASEGLRFERVGWHEGSFIIPGLEDDGVIVSIPRKLPYSLGGDTNLSDALRGLDFLIGFVGAEYAAPILSFILTAPFAHPANLRDERAAMFIKGRSGTFKTSTTQVAMSIYGNGFMNDESLLKWGEGATINAMLELAARCHDMPMFIDNYKPNTGEKGAYTKFTHAAIEGGTKERLNKASQLRDSKSIHTWPISTGEDLPTADPASLARHLIIEMPRGGDMLALGEAQAQAHNLSAIGRTWIEHLSTDGGRAQASTLRSRMFGTLRSEWAKRLAQTGRKMVNPYRVATNLAVNQMTWMMLELHPTLGEWAKQYSSAHYNGLKRMADAMVSSTGESLEASRFIAHLQECLASGKGYLIPDLSTPAERIADPVSRTRVIGWADGNGGAYLLPKEAIETIKRASGDDLGDISSTTLYQQLKELDMLHPGDKDKLTKKVRAGGGNPINALWIKAAALGAGDTREGESLSVDDL